jgi:hypothetical protein
VPCCTAAAAGGRVGGERGEGVGDSLGHGRVVQPEDGYAASSVSCSRRLRRRHSALVTRSGSGQARLASILARAAGLEWAGPPVSGAGLRKRLEAVPLRLRLRLRR